MKQGEFFYTDLPVSAALRDGSIRHVGHVALSSDESMPPPLRARAGIEKSGKVLSWWIISEANETLVWIT